MISWFYAFEELLLPFCFAIIRHTFKKSERLKNKKRIKKLFEQGTVLYLYPLRVVYLPYSSSTSSRHQVLFTVARKRFKNSVTRNKFKKRLREAYRLHKHLLDVPGGRNNYFLIGYSYIGNERQYSFHKLQAKVIASLQHLKRLDEKDTLAAT